MAVMVRWESENSDWKLGANAGCNNYRKELVRVKERRKVKAAIILPLSFPFPLSLLRK